MEILRDTPFEIGWLTWQLRPPRTSLTVVVKGTFALVPGGVCVPFEEQPLVTGDQHHDDDDTKSVRVESDLALLKPRGECLLAGTCHPPGGQARISAVSMRVEPSPTCVEAGRRRTVDKSVAVIGERRWRSSWLGTPPQPEPFASMPLAWERSFGGARCDDNPVGRGIDKDVSDGSTHLPNLEDPRGLLVERGQRPRPAGMGPIPRTWKARADKTGTYDARWKRTRFPWFPEDFDCAYFNAAPPDQQIDGYWRGDERITLKNLSPCHAVIDTRLPSVSARVFLVLARALDAVAVGAAPSLVEVPVRLDTLAIDTDAGTVTCLWRGLVEVEREDLADVAYLFAAHEPIDAHGALDAYARRFAALRAAEDAETVDAFGEEPPVLDADAAAPVSEGERDAVLASGCAMSTEKAAWVDARIAAGEPLSGFDLSFVDLSRRVLDGLDLSGSILTRAKLDGTSLRNARMDGAVLDGASFEGADLRGASLVGASLVGVHAAGARLDGARLDGASIEGAGLARASFRGASLRATILEGADLVRADFEDACLDEAELGETKLEEAAFLGASLIDASFLAADAPRAAFDRATITGMRAGDGANLARASFRECQGARASFRGANLDEADLFGSELEAADLADASLVSANLDGCGLRSARLERARLVGARARGADLFEACLEEADLSHADLRGANLFGAETWRARTEGARLESASIGRTKLGDR